MAAARVANLPHGVNKPREGASIEAPSVSQPDAAQMLNVSRRAMQRAGGGRAGCELAPWSKKEPREDAQICAPSLSQPDAAEMLNVSR